MILFDQPVQVPGLAQFDGHAAVGDPTAHGRGVGAVLVDRDLLQQVVRSMGLSMKAARRDHVAPGCEQEVHRLAEPIHGSNCVGIDSGMRFAMREGGKTVGAGIVTEVLG